MRITVDTNVFVSAILWKGNSLRIIELAESGSIFLFTSEEIMLELERTLNSDKVQKKINQKKLLINKTLTQIRNLCSFVTPSSRLNIVTEDPDDNKIMECALASHSDYIITKDDHLLKIESFKEVVIIHPDNFMRWLA